METSSRVYFPALDGLRALAFLAVFCHHYGLFPLGWMGVDCFFVLSGFLITGILLDTRDDPHRVRNFYIRRTLRIFPLYYTIFLAALITTPLFRWSWSALWMLWPAYLANGIGFFYPHGVSPATMGVIDGVLLTGRGTPVYFGHFWSLCVEEQFYLVWPWIVFSVRSRARLLWLCAAAILLCPLARILAVYTFPPGWSQAGVLLHSTPFRLDTLLFGAATALLHRGPYRERLLRIARPLAWLALPLGLWSLRPPTAIFGVPVGTFLETMGFSLIALLSAAIILRSLQPGSLCTNAFSLRPLRWLGRISYGAYIFHDIPHEFYANLGHAHRLLTAVIALVCTVGLASISFHFFETPFLRLKSRMTRTAPANASPAALPL